MYTLPLDVILGSPQLAAAVLNELTDDMVALDRLDRDRALWLVCERASHSDPLLLAAPGQVWVRRDDVDADEVPAPALEVLDRIEDAEGPGVLVRCLGGDTAEAVWPLQISGLVSYHLASWDYSPRPHRSWLAVRTRGFLATAWRCVRLASLDAIGPRPRRRGVRAFARSVLRAVARRTDAFAPSAPTA